MEVTAAPSATASQTIADLIPRAAERYGDRAAVRYKRDGAWQDVTYAELDEIVSEVALGLIDLGIEPGERVCILANTRPEWSYADLAITSAGAIVVPIYQTNSPEECHWVALRLASACAIVCEDATQLAKIAAIRDTLPTLRTIVVIDRGPPRPTPRSPRSARSRSTRFARAGASAASRGARRAPRRRAARGHRTRSSTPPARPVRRRAACSRHGNYRAIARHGRAARRSLQAIAEDVVYLFLPLAHSFALLLMLIVLRPRRRRSPTSAATPRRSSPSCPRSIRPTCRRCRAIFEKIYTLVTATARPGVARRRRARRH